MPSGRGSDDSRRNPFKEEPQPGTDLTIPIAGFFNDPRAVIDRVFKDDAAKQPGGGGGGGGTAGGPITGLDSGATGGTITGSSPTLGGGAKASLTAGEIANLVSTGAGTVGTIYGITKSRGGGKKKKKNRLPSFPNSAALGEVGSSNLMDLLLGKGGTDPARFNRQVRDAALGSQGLQQAIRGSLAGRGLGGSGVGAALEAAAAQGGEDRIAGIRANEAAIAEQRNLQALQLLLNIFGINTNIANTNIQGQAVANAQSNAETAAILAGLSELLGGIPGMVTTFKGNKTSTSTPPITNSSNTPFIF